MNNTEIAQLGLIKQASMEDIQKWLQTFAASEAGQRTIGGPAAAPPPPAAAPPPPPLGEVDDSYDNVAHGDGGITKADKGGPAEKDYDTR